MRDNSNEIEADEIRKVFNVLYMCSGIISVGIKFCVSPQTAVTSQVST